MKECQREYPVDGVMTNKVPICVPTHPQILVLTYGDGEKEVDLNSLSNSKLTEEDFNSFLSEREHHQQRIMTKSVRFRAWDEA